MSPGRARQAGGLGCLWVGGQRDRSRVHLQCAQARLRIARARSPYRLIPRASQPAARPFLALKQTQQRKLTRHLSAETGAMRGQTGRVHGRGRQGPSPEKRRGMLQSAARLPSELPRAFKFRSSAGRPARGRSQRSKPAQPEGPLASHAPDKDAPCQRASKSADAAQCLAHHLQRP